MLFKDFDLPQYLVKAIYDLGFDELTPIQEQSIPIIRSGKDMIGRSVTGSGKTFAFGIPAVERVDSDAKCVQVLVICPTRELATQVTDEMRKLTEYREGVKMLPLYGGSSMDRQIASLKKGVKIVVGTPGRIMDHMRRRTLRLKDLKMVVLDEADVMLDMGFREDIEYILSHSPDTRQTLLFSATMPKPIVEISQNFLKDPVMVEIGEENKPSDVKQYFHYVEKKNKTNALLSLLAKEDPSTCIIFTNTKKMVDDLTPILQKAGFSAEGLHGDMRQSERRKVMANVKEGFTSILIATDVAARGIDISDVDIVVNYDLPKDNDYYIHRIGRTARAGKSGKSVSIIANSMELRHVTELERITGTKMLEYEGEYSELVERVTITDVNRKGRVGPPTKVKQAILPVPKRKTKFYTDNGSEGSPSPSGYKRNRTTTRRTEDFVNFYADSLPQKKSKRTKTHTDGYYDTFVSFTDGQPTEGVGLMRATTKRSSKASTFKVASEMPRSTSKPRATRPDSVKRHRPSRPTGGKGRPKR